MSDAVIVALIGFLSASTVAIIGLLGVVLVQTRETHKLVNSRMTELLALAKRSGHQEGVSDEREREEAAK